MKSFRALAKHIESISIISFVFEDGTITLSPIFSQLILGRFILNAIVENQFENWSNECASVCVCVYVECTKMGRIVMSNNSSQKIIKNIKNNHENAGDDSARATTCLWWQMFSIRLAM